jgi:hypothetical protein
MPGILDEHVLTPAQAARYLPKIGLSAVSPTTVWRWCRKGVRGVHLEYARVGRRIVTSREALTRFGDALAEADRSIDDGHRGVE